MEIKKTLGYIGVIWLVLRLVIWLVTPSDPTFNAKQK
jgi:hypothetical protein